MRREEAEAAALLNSGKLDETQLRKLTESADGQKVRSLLGDEKALAVKPTTEPSSSRVVMTVTPEGKEPRTFL